MSREGNREERIIHGKRNHFATTKWTLILAAGKGSQDGARAAVAELCRSYWYPLYAHIRRLGYSKEDSEDLTQGFLANFLEKNPFPDLSPANGRFRSYLLVSLKNFLANDWDKNRRIKRGGGVEILSLDWHNADERYQTQPVDHLSPDKLFDRAWAMTLLGRVLEKLAVMHAQTPWFEALKICLTADRRLMDYSEVAENLTMSEGAVRVAVHRLRAQYRELLRTEIGETLVNQELVQEELNSLFQSFDS